MYPRNVKLVGHPPYMPIRGHNNGLYTPPPDPRHHHHLRLSDAHHNFNSSHPLPPVPNRIPPYEWKPTPSPSPAPTSHTSTMTNGRKRRSDDNSPPGQKRQRLDPFDFRQSLIQSPPRLRHHEEQAAGTSRKVGPSSDHSHLRPQPSSQVPPVPGSSSTLQDYAKDKPETTTQLCHIECNDVYHKDNSPPGQKRQHPDPFDFRQSLIQSPPRLHHHEEQAAGTSRKVGPSSDHSHLRPQPSPQVLPVPGSSSTLQDYAKDKLSSQMVELFEACQQQVSDLSRKEMCRTRLQRDIQNVFPVARLYLTGSSMNGLGCRTSDADLCLVLVGSMDRRPDPIHILCLLQKLFCSLAYLERPQLIRAKVPILKFREKGSGLEFDLNINNTVGIRNTFLLRSYAYADLRVRPIILVIKKWARHHQINDASKGTLSSYTLALMVLHYLQTLNEPVLPSLQKDYPECFNPSMEIDMVPEGPRHIPPFISRNQSSLGDLFLGFLKYYATVFSWDKQVISVREAKALPKSNSREWRDKYICVEEPFERNNVARAVHEKVKFDAIKAQFAESCRILQQRKDLSSILPFRATINRESSKR